MAGTFTNLEYHIVFSTKNRTPLIHPPIEDELWRYLAATCTACGCHTHRVGGTTDHVHIACELARTLAVSKLVEEAKKSSSKWMKTKGVTEFAWQNGYGAFSHGRSQLTDIVAYIAQQKEHHRHRTFQEEFREFLEKYNVQYDERYVWD